MLTLFVDEFFVTSGCTGDLVVTLTLWLQVEQTVWDEDGEERTEVMKGKKDVTTHLAIHTLHLDGLRELYRHFLRLPDGAIVEVITQALVAVKTVLSDYI